MTLFPLLRGKNKEEASIHPFPCRLGLPPPRLPSLLRLPVLVHRAPPVPSRRRLPRPQEVPPPVPAPPLHPAVSSPETRISLAFACRADLGFRPSRGRRSGDWDPLLRRITSSSYSSPRRLAGVFDREAVVASVGYPVLPFGCPAVPRRRLCLSAGNLIV